ncbi:fibronectin type III domain-containing protein [bacterium]|nr:fibronectin type III domain-containing protein [bacterium]
MLRILATIAIAIVFFAAAPALAEVTVSITGVNPANGVIAEGEAATIAWTINADTESGDYEAVVGGDGTPGTGDPVGAANGSGNFNGTTNGQSTVSADDLGGDGEYTVYIIATDSADATNYGSASTTITLDSPPEAVTGLTAGGGDKRVFLSWSSHPDADIDAYFVYYGNSPGTDAADYDGGDADIGVSPADVGTATEAIVGGLTNSVRYYFRVTAVDVNGTESPLSAEVSAVPADTLGAAELFNDTEGCFIATAAYGAKDARNVIALRIFRDRVLGKTGWGRALVRSYYRISPPIARAIADSPMLRAGVRAVVAPVAVYARVAVSPMKSAMSGFVLVAMLAFVFARGRRSGK